MIRRLALAGFMLLAAGINFTHAAEIQRPNILFAFADDWGRHANIYAQIDDFYFEKPPLAGPVSKPPAPKKGKNP